MKKGMWLKKGISLLLVFAMVVGMYVPGFAATTTQAGDSIPLVVLGDGVANGVGLENPDEESFAAQIAELIQTGGNHRLYAENLWRVEEVRYLLDTDYEGDGYTKRFMAEGNDVPTDFQTLRKNKTVINDVAAAENVVLHVGVNNFSSYIVEQMVYWLENGGYLGKTDAVKYEFNFDEFVNTDNEIKIEDTLEAVRLAVKDRLLVAAGSDMDKAVELIDFVTEAATYTILSYVKSFNATVNEILTLNPDVNLYVVGIYNPVNDEKLSVSIDGTTYDSFPMVDSNLNVYDQDFDLGAVFGGLIEIANAYTQVLAPRAYEYTYVHPGDPELLIDQMGDTSIVDENGNPDYKARISYELWDQILRGAGGIGETVAVDTLMETLSDYGLNYTEDEILDMLDEALSEEDTAERKAYLKDLIFTKAAEKAVGKFYLELAERSSELGTVVPYDANDEKLDPATITDDNAEIVRKIVIVKETPVGDTTETFSLVINAKKIGNLMDALEAADTDAEYTEAATDFVQNLIAESMVGKTFVNEYIDNPEEAATMLNTLEQIGQGDLAEMRKKAAAAVTKQIEDSDLSGYATTQDIENLLEALDAPSIQSEADQRAVISDWLNGLAARELVGEINKAGFTYTEEQAKTLLSKLDAEGTEEEQKAKAKELLLEDLFHDYMVDAIKGKLVDSNGDDKLTLPSYQTAAGTNDYDAFVTAIEKADTNADAQAIVREEVCKGIAAECGILGADAPRDSDVLALFAAADAEKANGEAAQKAVITDWVNTKYNSDPALQGVSTWQKIVAELCDKFWNGYTASVAAEEAFTTYRDKVDVATKAFSDFVSLRESATDSILKAYADNYKGASSAAQQYANAYIQIRDYAVDSIVDAYKKYQDDIDDALSAVDVFNEVFDKAYEVMCQIAEVDTIHLNDLITVAGRIVDFDASNKPVLNPDYSEDEIKTTVTEIAKALVRGDESVKDVKTVAYLALRYILADAVLVLPSANGHKTIADQIKLAMDTGNDVNSTAGGLANRVIDKTIDLYHAAKEFLKLPISASGQDGTLVNPDSYLVFGDNVTSGSALDDSTLAYPNVLAGVLAMDENDTTDANDDEKAGDVVGDYTVDGLRAEDLWAQVDGTYKGDAYTAARYGSAIADDNTAYSAQSGDGVDLVTVNVGINNLTTFPITQTMLAFNGEETHEMDWGRYIGDDRYAKINKGKDIAMGIMLRIVDSLESREPILDDLSAYERAERALETVYTAVESLLYGVVGYIANLDNAVEDIARQNPNAVIVLTGFYNPLVGTYVNTGKTVPYYDIEAREVKTTTLPDRNISVGKWFDYVLNQTNRHLTNYVGAPNAADEGSRIVVATIEDTELQITAEYGANKDLSVLRDWKTVNVKGHPITIKVPDYLVKANDGSSLGDALHPSVDGHAYIADQILTALDFDIYADVVLEDKEIFVGEALSDSDFVYEMDDESTLFGNGEYLGVKVVLCDAEGNSVDPAVAAQTAGTYTIKAELTNEDYELDSETAEGAVYKYIGSDDGYTEVEIKYATLKVKAKVVIDLAAKINGEDALAALLNSSADALDITVAATDAEDDTAITDEEVLDLIDWKITDENDNPVSIEEALSKVGIYTITPTCELTEDLKVKYELGESTSATLTVTQEVTLEVVFEDGSIECELPVNDGVVNTSSTAAVKVIVKDYKTGVALDTTPDELNNWVITHEDGTPVSGNDIENALKALDKYTIAPAEYNGTKYVIKDTAAAVLNVVPVTVEVSSDKAELNGTEVAFSVTSNAGDITDKISGYTFDGKTQAEALAKKGTYKVEPVFVGTIDTALVKVTPGTLEVVQYIEKITVTVAVDDDKVCVNDGVVNTASAVNVSVTIKTAGGVDVVLPYELVITEKTSGKVYTELGKALENIGEYTITAKCDTTGTNYSVENVVDATLEVEQIWVKVMPVSVKVGHTNEVEFVVKSNVINAANAIDKFVLTDSEGEVELADALNKAGEYTITPIFKNGTVDPELVAVTTNKLTVSKTDITPKALLSKLTYVVGTASSADEIGLTVGAYAGDTLVDDVVVDYKVYNSTDNTNPVELSVALSTVGEYVIIPSIDWTKSENSAVAHKYNTLTSVEADLEVVAVTISAKVTSTVNPITVGTDPSKVTITIEANRDDAKALIDEQNHIITNEAGENVDLATALTKEGIYTVHPEFDGDVTDAQKAGIVIDTTTFTVTKRIITFSALVNGKVNEAVELGTTGVAVTYKITGGNSGEDFASYIKEANGEKEYVFAKGGKFYTLEEALAKVGTYNVYPVLTQDGTDVYKFEVLEGTTLQVKSVAKASAQFAKQENGQTVYTSELKTTYGSMTVDQMFAMLNLTCTDSAGNVIEGAIVDGKFFTLLDENGNQLTDENGSVLYGKAALAEALKNVGSYTVQLVLDENITGEYDVIWGEKATLVLEKKNASVVMGWNKSSEDDYRVIQGIDSDELTYRVYISADELKPAVGEPEYRIVNAAGEPVSSIVAAAQVPGTYTITPNYVPNPNYNISVSGLKLIVYSEDDVKIVASVSPKNDYPVDSSASAVKISVKVQDENGNEVNAPGYLNGYTITNGAGDEFSLDAALKVIGTYTITPKNPKNIAAVESAELKVTNRNIDIRISMVSGTVIEGLSVAELDAVPTVSGALEADSEWSEEILVTYVENGVESGIELAKALERPGTYTLTPVCKKAYDEEKYTVTIHSRTLTVVAATDIVIEPVIHPSNELIEGTDPDNVYIEVEVRTQNGDHVYAPDVVNSQKPYTIIDNSITDPAQENEVTLTQALAKEGTYTVVPNRGSGSTAIPDANFVTETLTVLPKAVSYNVFRKLEALLNLESEVSIVVDATIFDEYLDDGIDFEGEMGIMVWPSSVGMNEETAILENATEAYDGYTIRGARKIPNTTNKYRVYTDGIPAKEYGDNLSLRLFVKLPNGQYSYSKFVAEYCVEKYAYNKIKESPDPTLVEVCKALLNYGAAAQGYFGYKTDDLVNAELTSEHQETMDAMMAVASTYLDSVPTVDANKPLKFTPTLDNSVSGWLQLDGSTNMVFSVLWDAGKLDEIAEMYLYYWTVDQYEASAELDFVQGQKVALERCDPIQYKGHTIRAIYSGKGTAAKELGDGIYFTIGIRLKDSDEFQYRKLGAYSVERYAQRNWTSTEGDYGVKLGELMQRMTVYGECAKIHLAVVNGSGQ